MNWLESIIFGIVSGFTEFVPVSAQAHKTILLNLFGEDMEHALMSLAIHAGTLLALIVSSAGMFRQLYREYRYSKLPKRRRKREVDRKTVLDFNFTKTALILLVIGDLFYLQAASWQYKLPLISVFLVLNGLLLHIPMYLSRGNKDSRNMSALDAVLFGMASALSVLPGVSRVGASSSVAIARGADPQHALRWCLMLSVPALAILTCFDVYSLFSAGLSGLDFTFLLNCLLAGGAAYFGAGLAVASMRIIAVRSGFSSFSYYSWGAALFAFILYLY